MANSGRPQEKQDTGDSSNVLGTFERLAKVLGFLFGGLYVLGLVISNAQLQRLGLSDFSILQPRCIATGMLFALYMLLAMLLLTPMAALFLGAIGIFEGSKRVTTRIGLFFILVVVCGFIELLLLLLVSSFYGSLTPWIVIYPPEDEFVKQQMEQLKLSFSDRVHLLSDNAYSIWSRIGFGWNLFGHSWAAFTAGAGVAWIAVELEEYVPTKGGLEGIKRGLEGRRLLIVGMLVVVFAYAAPGFARDVYPNIDQSVGGGQPTIARVQISGTLPLIEDGKTFRRVKEETSGKDTKSFIVTEPLVIWYQSASFIYVSPLIVNDRKQRPIGIDAKSVQVIQQVSQAVEVYDGTRVMAVHDLR